MKVVDLEPIVVEAGCGASFEFRIEILREVGRRRFRSAVYRRETFRLAPAFPVGPGPGADEPLFVPDPHWAPVEGPTAQGVLRRAAAAIAETFGIRTPGTRRPRRRATRRPARRPA